MGQINLSNSNGRDAMVSTLSVRKAKKVRWCDNQQRQAQGCRVLKSSIDKDVAALTKAAGAIEKVAELMIAGDPELDAESFGRFLKETSSVFINPEGKVVNKVKQFEVVKNPDGTERERRPRKIAQANCAIEGQPLKWSGRLMKKVEVYNKFVFSSKQQIGHVNGLTYDFLYAMAKELEEKQSMLFVGSGPKGIAPLIFTRGGQNYRGFLEGRTDGPKYCLLLHLSNLEMKAPPKAAADEAPAEAVKPASESTPPAATPAAKKVEVVSAPQEPAATEAKKPKASRAKASKPANEGGEEEAPKAKRAPKKK